MTKRPLNEVRDEFIQAVVDNSIDCIYARIEQELEKTQGNLKAALNEGLSAARFQPFFYPDKEFLMKLNHLYKVTKINTLQTMIDNSLQRIPKKYHEVIKQSFLATPPPQPVYVPERGTNFEDRYECS